MNQEKNRPHSPSQRARTVALFRSDNTDTIEDIEFGAIAIKRSSRAKYVRLRMDNTGALIVTLPQLASAKLAYDIVGSSRIEIREWKKKFIKKTSVYRDGDSIGLSHKIKFIPENRSTVHIKISKLTIYVYHPITLFPSDTKIQTELKPYLKKVIQKEARTYLPKRLSSLAETHGFSFERIRFGTQKGRWGSCSSRGTISLNVNLMLLDKKLIDYVLVHELCHTLHMNHSQSFWSCVASIMPDYKIYRKSLKSTHPSL